MLVIVGMMTDAHSFSSHVGIGSESDCLLGHSKRILRISDSETGVKEEKSGGVSEGVECKYGDDVVGLLTRERRSLDILSVKKEAKESASEVPGAVSYTHLTLPTNREV